MKHGSIRLKSLVLGALVLALGLASCSTSTVMMRVDCVDEGNTPIRADIYVNGELQAKASDNKVVTLDFSRYERAYVQVVAADCEPGHYPFTREEARRQKAIKARLTPVVR